MEWAYYPKYNKYLPGEPCEYSVFVQVVLIEISMAVYHKVLVVLFNILLNLFSIITYAVFPNVCENNCQIREHVANLYIIPIVKIRSWAKVHMQTIFWLISHSKHQPIVIIDYE